MSGTSKATRHFRAQQGAGRKGLKQKMTPFSAGPKPQRLRVRLARPHYAKSMRLTLHFFRRTLTKITFRDNLFSVCRVHSPMLAKRPRGILFSKSSLTTTM